MDERITTAGVAVIDRKVLVAQRKEGGPLSLKWEFPGGKNRYGESIEDTLMREWKEELGVDISVGDFLACVDFENNGILYHLKFYEVIPLSLDFSLNEHKALLFADKTTLSRLDFGQSDSEIRNYILKECDIE